VTQDFKLHGVELFYKGMHMGTIQVDTFGIHRWLPVRCFYIDQLFLLTLHSFLENLNNGDET